ncbi:MAG: DUF3800 domain-containing protein [Acetobacter sp.]|uniref:DUF3800 domain-containing protein n=1 Tax=Acetobacter sp. TaxID=440 RepID=UPI003F8E6FB3
MPKEFLIYCDESLDKGKYYGNFYGGALVTSDDVDRINEELISKKEELNITAEAKWNKITANYSEKYIELIDCFFDLIKCGKIKIRIMFSNKNHQPKGLTKEQKEDSYFILYYLFLQHSFGLAYSNINGPEVNLRLYLDDIPDTKEKVERFRDFICKLQDKAHFKTNNIKIKKENITEVKSHSHAILQCLDIVLGSMQFRLNDMHKVKPEGMRTRGKRTIAKEKVYKHINKRIREIYNNFNIGITTGTAGDPENRWRHPYRHWCFIPKNYNYLGISKKKKVAPPQLDVPVLP